MTQIGKWNQLRMIKELNFGVYLDGEELGEILMPRRYIPEGLQVDDLINVFVYNDSEDRLVAITDTPLCTVGEFGYLQVVQTAPSGAFLDWGLPKDVLVPFRHQTEKMQTGKFYLVRLLVDPVTDRIIGTTKYQRYLNKAPFLMDEGDAVDLIIERKTDLGYSAIINHTHTGVLYANEIFQPIAIGQKLTGYVRRIRQDGKIDLSLQEHSYGPGEISEDLSALIIRKIEEAGGRLPLGDKSDPKLIYDTFGVSKKIFKKTVGTLFKLRKIRVAEDGLHLN
jgi:predicted RNA-binding protein (virulence factor B family)